MQTSRNPYRAVLSKKDVSQPNMRHHCSRVLGRQEQVADTHLIQFVSLCSVGLLGAQAKFLFAFPSKKDVTAEIILPLQALDGVWIELEFSHVCSRKKKGISGYLLVFNVRAIKNPKLHFADNGALSSQFLHLLLSVFCLQKPCSLYVLPASKEATEGNFLHLQALDYIWMQFEFSHVCNSKAKGCWLFAFFPCQSCQELSSLLQREHCTQQLLCVLVFVRLLYAEHTCVFCVPSRQRI